MLLRSKSRNNVGAQWLSGRVLDSRPKGRGFEPHRRHCVVSLSKNINPSLVLVQPRKTRPFITERSLMGRKESNQTNKQTRNNVHISRVFYRSSVTLTLRIRTCKPWMHFCSWSPDAIAKFPDLHVCLKFWF